MCYDKAKGHRAAEVAWLRVPIQATGADKINVMADAKHKAMIPDKIEALVNESIVYAKN